MKLKARVAKSVSRGAAAAVVLVAGLAWGAPPTPSHYKPWSQEKIAQNRAEEYAEIKPSKVVEPLPSGTMELKIGQKVSYKTKNVQVVMSNPDLALMQMNDKGVLTIVPKRKGEAMLFVFPGNKGGAPSADDLKNPKTIRVTVR